MTGVKETAGRPLLLACAVAIAASFGAAGADPIQFRPAQALADGGALNGMLLPGNPTAGFALPFVVDWNGDGKKDLLVGYSTGQPDCLVFEPGHGCAAPFHQLHGAQDRGWDHH